ncbi:hypothetical protein [Methylobacterium nigriterrae]|uniref:hypothetical protein n=1 Tax=Methylobacterium nigriterrae TaxID=3127512 RepID=UPI0030135DF2
MTTHPPYPAAHWRRFALAFAAAAVGLGCAAAGFIAAMDPYGLRAGPGRAPGPIMDLNQRFMYPQIVRGGAYDAAVFGTSTARLLDPRDLDAAFGARFANLAMNAATPFEQRALARLFLGRDAVTVVIFALDATWCAADADRRRLTFRPFPPWLYEPGTPLGTIRQVNWQSLATAGRVALHRLGRAPARIRGDGYAVFTPPEASYDAARAAAHIHGGNASAEEAADGASAEEDAGMPALAWLDGLLASVPANAVKLVAFMPVHAAAQGRPGTPQGAREAACKAEVAAIGRRRAATVVDFRIPSPVTTQDANYWDALHYRLPVAGRVVAGLRAARETGADDPKGFYRVLAHP